MILGDAIHAPRREPAEPDAPVSLGDLGDQLLDLARSLSAGRSARALMPGSGAILKQTLLALVSGTTLDEHEAPGPASILVVAGEVRMGTGDGDVTLATGQWAPIPDQPHDLSATSDAVVLLTVGLAPR